jgi:hypothetical protein
MIREKRWLYWHHLHRQILARKPAVLVNWYSWWLSPRKLSYYYAISSFVEKDFGYSATVLLYYPKTPPAGGRRMVWKILLYICILHAKDPEPNGLFLLAPLVFLVSREHDGWCGWFRELAWTIRHRKNTLQSSHYTCLRETNQTQDLAVRRIFNKKKL